MLILSSNTWNSFDKLYNVVPCPLNDETPMAYRYKLSLAYISSYLSGYSENQLYSCNQLKQREGVYLRDIDKSLNSASKNTT